MRLLNRKPGAIRVRRNFVATRSKLLIVIALVLLATAAWFANSDPGSTTREYFVASRDLAKSTKIASTTVERMQADLATSGGRYLLADEGQLDKWFLTEPVASGELIPISSLASKRQEDCSPIILSLGSTLPSTLRAGSIVDLWAAQQSTTFDSIPYEFSGMGESLQKVEVCVSAAEVRSVVEAIAKQSTVVAVRSRT
ncbi:MAG: hypothetical protein EBT76_01390 [Microbacteriaceae bacterium]|nr:hypothetical protein [Microbacteriaceae bacterium]